MRSIPFEFGTDSSTSQPNEDMLREIGAILTKNGVNNRFGLTAIQENLPEGIVMNETTDQDARIQIVKPAAIKGLGQHVQTGWRLDKPGMTQACNATCQSTPQGHRPNHEKTTEIK